MAGPVERYPDVSAVVGTHDGCIVEDGLCTCDRSLFRDRFSGAGR